jgi:hypothetical protein
VEALEVGYGCFIKFGLSHTLGLLVNLLYVIRKERLETVNSRILLKLRHTSHVYSLCEAVGYRRQVYPQVI